MIRIKAAGIAPEWEVLAARLLEGKIPADASEIYSGRNRILRLQADGIDVAVKFFSHSLKNRLIYSIFSSKAERSYLYAIELTRLGIHTPAPLAYAERRGFLNTLQDSVYLCRYEEATDLRDYLESGPEAWREFGRFAALLHRKGVLHKDLNSTNVRVNAAGSGRPVFSLIDLNRMNFYPGGISGSKAYANLVRFSYLTPEFTDFARSYAEAAGFPESAVSDLIRAKERHEKK
ncbi:MAG: hypothetical protein K2N88_05750 [Muribaculaceae bacterium]|nr:hypothetical protein [Muribaculaceae bacterium]